MFLLFCVGQVGVVYKALIQGGKILACIDEVGGWQLFVSWLDIRLQLWFKQYFNHINPLKTEYEL